MFPTSSPPQLLDNIIGLGPCPPENIILLEGPASDPANHTYSNTFTELEHYVLTCYLLLVITVGLSANSFVIYASLKYHTFSLDKVTILFLRHLAITDLLMVVFLGVPMLGVHLTQPQANPYQTLPVLCLLLGSVYEILVHSHIMFYMVIALHRFFRCLFPLKLQTITMIQGRVCCSCVWVLGVGVSIGVPYTLNYLSTVDPAAGCGVSGAVPPKGAWSLVRYYQGMATCAAVTDSNTWYWFNITYTLAMIVTVIAVNFVTLFYSNYISATSRVKSHNIAAARVTVAAMGLCAVLSNLWVPYLLLLDLVGTDREGQIRQKISEDKTGQKILTHLPIVTALVNPLIYTLVNRRFKTFLLQELKRHQQGLLRERMRRCRRDWGGGAAGDREDEVTVRPSVTSVVGGVVELQRVIGCQIPHLPALKRDM